MNTTKYPVTVREAIEMARKLGMLPSELFAMLGPIPMPPEGYTLAPKSDDRWIGPETMSRRWIITPAWTWDSNGAAHSIEVWMADHKRPTYANITPAEALQLAVDLTAVASKIAAAEATEA